MARIICTVTNDLTYDQRMIRIGTSLQRAGHQVVLVGRRKHSSAPLEDYPFTQKRLACFFEKGKAFYLEYNLRLLLFLLFQRFDTVNGVDLDTLLPAYLAARWKGGRCVYDAHEYFTEVPELVGRPGAKKAWERLARWLIPRVDSAYTVGKSLAEVFEKRYGRPFGVVRNLPFAQPLVERAAPVLDHPVLLYQGALNDGRGLPETIEALADLPNAQLWLAGEGDLSKALREQAAATPYAERIHFWGHVKPADLPSITRQATIGLNLLENKGLNYYFSLANKAFDYLQAGIPGLHMDFPEYRNLQSRYGCFILVKQCTPGAIIEAVKKALDPETYRHLQAKSQSAAKELVWEAEEKRLLAFYTNPSLA